MVVQGLLPERQRRPHAATLTAPAPLPGGQNVGLFTLFPQAGVPTQVVIPGGMATGSFQFTGLETGQPGVALSGNTFASFLLGDVDTGSRHVQDINTYAIYWAQGLFVQDVPIVFSETSFVMPVLVQPVSQPCFEGALGADVLRQCTIVWGSKSLWAACRPAT